MIKEVKLIMLNVKIITIRDEKIPQQEDHEISKDEMDKKLLIITNEIVKKIKDINMILIMKVEF